MTSHHICNSHRSIASSLSNHLLRILAVLVVLTHGAAIAQQDLRFGKPISATPSFIPQNLLPLATQRPPKTLAEGAEVIVVSGYEPSRIAEDRTILVTVRRPGAKVLLVLSSYEKVHWKVEASAGTQLSAILASGHRPPTVSTTSATEGYAIRLPYVQKAGSPQFRGMMAALNGLFGVERVDVFRGSYSIPSVVGISRVDAPRAELSLSGPLPSAPRANFAFELLTAGYAKVRWTLTGPQGKQDGNTALSGGKVAISKSGKTIYRLKNDRLEILDTVSGKSAFASLPSHFPEFSWVTDIAVDTRRSVVSLFSLGGEGYLYRFDERRQRWIDYRSLNNVDIYSVSYDAVGDRYVAWADGGRLIFISAGGEALFSRSIASKLPGFSHIADIENSPVPRLRVSGKGDDVALIHLAGGSVDRIWHYSVQSDDATFTYARPLR